MRVQGEERELREVGLYVHVPFCLSRCPYCDFYSTGAPGPLDRYADAVAAELDLVVGELFPGGGVRLDSVYFGGGTPTLLGPAAASALLSRLKAPFVAAPDLEVSFEANPGSLDPEGLRLLRRAGVTRISLGVQSLDDGLLRTLGRIHDAASALDAFRLARLAGFENISVDLIYGIPGQTLERWVDTLDRAVGLGPDHVSVYGLTIEGDVPFHDLYGPSAPLAAAVPDDDAQAAMFESAFEVLGAAGYERYELSSYALAGRTCRHNLRYWSAGDYIGLGPSAASYVRGAGRWGRRWRNAADLDGYLEALEAGARPPAECEELTKGQAAMEDVFLSLRTSAGLDLEGFRDRYGVALEEGRAARELMGQGWLVRRGERLALADRAAPLANEVLTRLLDVDIL